MVRTTERFKLSTPKPWENTAASVSCNLLPSLEGTHPCHDCLAPCCWQVIVSRSRLLTGSDLEYLDSVLEYRDVSLWVGADGAYSVVLLSRCHHFDEDSCGCAIYGTPERPDICESYDGYSCWYRKVLDNEKTIRISRENWAAFREQVEISQEGDLIHSIPSRNELMFAHCKTVRSQKEQPVVLEFPITEESIGHTTLDDYLLFLGNFNQVSLIRSSGGWSMLFKTFRRGDGGGADWEYRPGSEESDTVEIDRRALSLLRGHTDFPAWSVSQLQAFLGNKEGA